MKKIFISGLCWMPLLITAAPAPFGLEIGVTTIDQAKQKYTMTFKGVNEYSQGEMYNISGINFDGIETASAIFSKDGKLLAILTTLPKSKFDYLYENLSSKYKLISNKIPFVGNKYAEFYDKGTKIFLEAPHMSFTMEMNYIQDSLWKSYQRQTELAEREKQQAEKNQL